MTQLSRQIKKIGQYQLGDLLGRGSIGTVYKGLNLENGTLVAIKQVSMQQIRDEQHKALHQEITLLKKLKHDNIVKYIDCIETDGLINIILEYIESGSLASIIKKFGAFPESLVAIYIKQVLIGLEYLHQQGVVHRDIKGANILTTKDGYVVKLADFGVAARLTDDENSMSLVGTPYWMAPEIIEMRGHISTSCDIWSLGCTVIELLTGNPPYFDLMQYPALFRIVQDDCPPLPEEISVECRDFLIHCFHKDPSERIDARQLLIHPWIQLMQPNPLLQMIKGPNADLPVEVTNTIRMHIDSQVILSFNKSNDALLKNLEVASVAQSNFATIIDQGSFISVDAPNQSPQQPAVSYTSPVKHKPKNDVHSPLRQSLLRDSQMDSLRQLKMRKSQQQNPFNGVAINLHLSQGIWAHNEDGKIVREINEIVHSIQQLHLNESKNSDLKISQHVQQLLEILQNYTKVKHHIVNTIGLSCFLQIFDQSLRKFCSNDDIDIQQVLIHQIMQLINSVVEQDNELLEQACLFGCLSLMQQVSAPEYPRDLRIESAYFLGQLAYSSQQTLTILLSSGGIQSLLDFLEPNIEENQELIFLAIDSILLIYEHHLINNTNLSRILASNSSTLSLRLTVITDNIFQMLFQNRKKLNKSSQSNLFKYLNKALDILIIFSKCEDQYVKLTLCRFQIVKMLAICLKKFLIEDERCFEILHRLVKIFKYLSTEPTLIAHFENFEIISNCLVILDRVLIELSKCQSDQFEEKILIVADLLKLIFHLTKLNPVRQQELALNQGIQQMLQLCSFISHKKTKNEDNREEMVQMKKVAMAILCSLVLSGDKSRRKLQEYGGIIIYIDFLNDQIKSQMSQVDDLSLYSRSPHIVHGTVTKLLDTIVNFVDNSDDKQRVNDDLTSQKAVDVLIYCFQSVNIPTFQQIVPIFQKLLSISNRLCKVLVRSPVFCKDLSDYLQEQHCLSPLTVKQLLGIIYHLLPFMGSPIEFFNKYNLLSVCERLRGDIGLMERGLAVQQVAEMIGVVLALEQRPNRKQKSWKLIDEADLHKSFLQVRASPQSRITSIPQNNFHY